MALCPVVAGLLVGALRFASLRAGRFASRLLGSWAFGWLNVVLFFLVVVWPLAAC